MTETAGWGTPSWLPPRIARQVAQTEARDAIVAREAEAARSTRAEEWHERNMALARQQAELRGEDISVIDLAAGRVRGRPLADILAGAAAMGDRQDAAEAWRRERGEAERVECFVSDPVIHHPTARSEHAVTMRRLYRRFTESRQANRVAAEKRRRLDAELLPLQETVTLSRPAPDPVAPPWEATRSDTSEDIRIRYGGPVTGIW